MRTPQIFNSFRARLVAFAGSAAGFDAGGAVLRQSAVGQTKRTHAG